MVYLTVGSTHDIYHTGMCINRVYCFLSLFPLNIYPKDSINSKLQCYDMSKPLAHTARTGVCVH